MRENAITGKIDYPFLDTVDNSRLKVLDLSQNRLMGELRAWEEKPNSGIFECQPQHVVDRTLVSDGALSSRWVGALFLDSTVTGVGCVELLLFGANRTGDIRIIDSFDNIANGSQYLCRKLPLGYQGSL
jgi:hypothetical protein